MKIHSNRQINNLMSFRSEHAKTHFQWHLPHSPVLLLQLLQPVKVRQNSLSLDHRLWKAKSSLKKQNKSHLALKSQILPINSSCFKKRKSKKLQRSSKKKKKKIAGCLTRGSHLRFLLWNQCQEMDAIPLASVKFQLESRHFSLRHTTQKSPAPRPSKWSSKSNHFTLKLHKPSKKRNLLRKSANMKDKKLRQSKNVAKKATRTQMKVKLKTRSGQESVISVITL